LPAAGADFAAADSAEVLGAGEGGPGV
jgi:hypothetical protein